MEDIATQEGKNYGFIVNTKGYVLRGRKINTYKI